MTGLNSHFYWLKLKDSDVKSQCDQCVSKTFLYLFILFLPLCTACFSAGTFSKIPTGHWAYEAISQLSEKGIIQKIDQSFLRGDKALTRYEFANLTAHALKNIGTSRVDSMDIPLIEKLTVEFTDELTLLGVKVSSMLLATDELKTGLLKSETDELDGKSLKNTDTSGLRFSLNGDIDFIMRKTARKNDSIEDDWENEVSLGMNYFMNIDKNIFAFMRLQNESVPWNEIGNQENGYIDQLYIDIKNLFDTADFRIGRQYYNLGKSLVLNDKMDGIRLSRNFGNINVSAFSFTTGKANSKINEQDYGDASGSHDFWVFDDTYALTGIADSNNAPYTQNNVTGSLNNYTTNVGGARFNPGSDRVTLYTSPYKYPAPFDSIMSNTGKNLVNSHSGIAITNGLSSLIPLDVARNFGLFSGVASTVQDADKKEIQNLYNAGASAGSMARDWQIESASGFDSFGADINFALGNLNVGAYFLGRSYNRFDPYTRLGDPWAAMCDSNGDNIVDTDLNGLAKSPEADPWYLGFTFDGQIFSDLEYFFEYVHYEPDITNIGVNPEFGTALVNNEFVSHDLDTGHAWVMGVDYTFAKRLNILLQYGAGSEEFIPASIYWTRSLNGMRGRLNSASPATSLDRDYDEGTYGLTGIKDFLLKVTAEFTDRTKGQVTYESVSDNDTSDLLVSGAYDVTGHLPQDYDIFSLEVCHEYTKQAKFLGRYTFFEYEESILNAARYQGNSTIDDNEDWGGWSRFEAELQVSF